MEGVCIKFVSMEGVCIKLFLWKASASNCFYDRLLQFVLMVGVQMVSMAGLCIKFVSIASPSIKFVLMASICIKSVLLQTCSLKAITNNIYTAMILFCLFVVVIFWALVHTCNDLRRKKNHCVYIVPLTPLQPSQSSNPFKNVKSWVTVILTLSHNNVFM